MKMIHETHEEKTKKICVICGSIFFHRPRMALAS